MGAIFAPTRFSLVRISIRDLVADGKSLARNSEVGGGGSKSDPQKKCENGHTIRKIQSSSLFVGLIF